MPMIDLPLVELAQSLVDWSDQAKRCDLGTDPALNDPAPYAHLRVVSGGARGGVDLAAITVTNRQAVNLAAGFNGRFGGTPTASPKSLAAWLGCEFYDPAAPATCRVVVCDITGRIAGTVGLSTRRAAQLAEQLRQHIRWLEHERLLSHTDCPFPEGSRVRVERPDEENAALRGRTGVVSRAKLLYLEPFPDWLIHVRLDDDHSGYPRIFRVDSISRV
jgi:hypothetical protein